MKQKKQTMALAAKVAGGVVMVAVLVINVMTGIKKDDNGALSLSSLKAMAQSGETGRQETSGHVTLPDSPSGFNTFTGSYTLYKPATPSAGTAYVSPGSYFDSSAGLSWSKTADYSTVVFNGGSSYSVYWSASYHTGPSPAITKSIGGSASYMF